MSPSIKFLGRILIKYLMTEFHYVNKIPNLYFKKEQLEKVSYSELLILSYVAHICFLFFFSHYMLWM